MHSSHSELELVANEWPSTTLYHNNSLLWSTCLQTVLYTHLRYPHSACRTEVNSECNYRWLSACLKFTMKMSVICSRIIPKHHKEAWRYDNYVLQCQLSSIAWLDFLVTQLRIRQVTAIRCVDINKRISLVKRKQWEWRYVWLCLYSIALCTDSMYPWFRETFYLHFRYCIKFITMPTDAKSTNVKCFKNDCKFNLLGAARQKSSILRAWFATTAMPRLQSNREINGGRHHQQDYRFNKYERYKQ